MVKQLVMNISGLRKRLSCFIKAFLTGQFFQDQREAIVGLCHIWSASALHDTVTQLPQRLHIFEATVQLLYSKPVRA